jgi:hypothetical protein
MSVRTVRLQAARQCLVYAAVIGVLILSATARAGERRGTHDRVVAYFTGRPSGGDWRIFDPVSRTDTLFGSFGGGAVYWDTTESYAEYLASGRLYRVEWEMEAQPWPEVQLPSEVFDLVDWWFNPDSLCWQAAGLGGVPRNFARNEARFSHCHSELWQSDQSGDDWRIADAETTDCGGCYFCETWENPNPRATRRRPAIGLNRLREAMTIDGWGGTPEKVPPPVGESPSTFDWYFIAFRTAPGRGLALRLGHRTPDLRTFMMPFYLMDRVRGTQRLLETPESYRDQELWRIGMAEYDGYLLVSGTRNYVYDLSTGEQIFHPRSHAGSGAVWIARPRPARVDSIGLRRLRARFR